MDTQEGEKEVERRLREHLSWKGLSGKKPGRVFRSAERARDKGPSVSRHDRGRATDISGE